VNRYRRVRKVMDHPWLDSGCHAVLSVPPSLASHLADGPRNHVQLHCGRYVGL